MRYSTNKKYKILFSAFQTKKKLIEKTQKQKNDTPLKSWQNQKNRQNSIFSHPGAHIRYNDRFWTIFDDLAVINPRSGYANTDVC